MFSSNPPESSTLVGRLAGINFQVPQTDPSWFPTLAEATPKEMKRFCAGDGGPTDLKMKNGVTVTW